MKKKFLFLILLGLFAQKSSLLGMQREIRTPQDFPKEIIVLLFTYVPSSEVFSSHIFVCRAFYDARLEYIKLVPVEAAIDFSDIEWDVDLEERGLCRVKRIWEEAADDAGDGFFRPFKRVRIFSSKSRCEAKSRGELESVLDDCRCLAQFLSNIVNQGGKVLLRVMGIQEVRLLSHLFSCLREAHITLEKLTLCFFRDDKRFGHHRRISHEDYTGELHVLGSWVDNRGEVYMVSRVMRDVLYSLIEDPVSRCLVFVVPFPEENFYQIKHGRAVLVNQKVKIAYRETPDGDELWCSPGEKMISSRRFLQGLVFYFLKHDAQLEMRLAIRNGSESELLDVTEHKFFRLAPERLDQEEVGEDGGE